MNFLAPEFSVFLARSLCVLEQEVPELYRKLADAILNLKVSCQIDDTKISIVGQRDRIRLEADGSLAERSLAQVTLRSSRALILELLSGTLTLEEAVFAERLVLVGHLDHILKFYEGLLLFLSGVVRCPSITYLLEDYRQDPVTKSRSENHSTISLKEPV